jgi:hypothetical protein
MRRCRRLLSQTHASERDAELYGAFDVTRNIFFALDH